MKPVFAVKFDPRLPSISSIQAKHWRAMVSQNQYLAKCFPKPPLTAFKRPKNIKEFLIRAKVPLPPEVRNKRDLKGMKKCTKQCSACPYISEGRNIKINKRNTWKIYKRLDCNSFNVIYMIECNIDKCRKRYSGTTRHLIKY